MASIRCKTDFGREGFFIATRAEVEQLYISFSASLFSHAYRMLGRVIDAEDIIQETFLVLNEIDLERIFNVRSYLFKIVTNRCLDHLQSTSKQREVYVGTWLPEPLMSGEDDGNDPSQAYLMEESISTAYLLLLQQLSGVERAVFLLREVLQYDYDEIAEIVGKTSTNCRQIFHRAKRSLGNHPVSDLSEPIAPERNHQSMPKNPLNIQQANTLVTQFLRALTIGDVDKLLNTLSEDATLYVDGGGKVKVFMDPVHGSVRISRSLAGFPNQISSGCISRITAVNGQPGIIFIENGQIIVAFTFQFREDRIHSIYTVANPEKLLKI